MQDDRDVIAKVRVVVHRREVPAHGREEVLAAVREVIELELPDRLRVLLLHDRLRDDFLQEIRLEFLQGRARARFLLRAHAAELRLGAVHVFVVRFFAANRRTNEGGGSRERADVRRRSVKWSTPPHLLNLACRFF